MHTYSGQYVYSLIVHSNNYTNAASAIHDITQNFQIGFGSFVDKRRVPYISVEPSRSVDVLLEY